MRWDARLGEAAPAIEAAAAEPPNLWDRISARIDAVVSARGALTVPSDEGAWELTSPGVRRKLLHVEAEDGWQSVMVCLAPGSEISARDHPILEECLVLEGEVEVGGATIRKGDLHLAFAGHDHGPIVSRTGALLYIRAGVPG
ncbi:MAG TPA: cupin domain-containing protein [Caulobacteraceae bacterium]